MHLFKKPIHAYSLENVCECQNKAIIVIYVKSVCHSFFTDKTLYAQTSDIYIYNRWTETHHWQRLITSQQVWLNQHTALTCCMYVVFGELHTQPHTIAVICGLTPTGWDSTAQSCRLNNGDHYGGLFMKLNGNHPTLMMHRHRQWPDLCAQHTLTPSQSASNMTINYKQTIK